MTEVGNPPLSAFEEMKRTLMALIREWDELTDAAGDEWASIAQYAQDLRAIYAHLTEATLVLHA